MAVPERSRSTGGFLARLRRFLGLGEEAAIADQIADALEESEDDDLQPAQRAMLLNILGLHEKRIEDIMVPRADIVALADDADLVTVIAAFQEEGHSRLPIYRRSLDHPTGMVHIRDLTPLLAARNGAADRFELAEVRREVLFAPPSMPVFDLLLKMQTTHIHLALVIDEYGGTDGLVTLEDMVEEIVGEIEDEHDTDEDPQVHIRPDGGFDVDARVRVEDFEEQLGLDLLPDDQDEDVDTLGGLVFVLAGRVPQRGEVISHSAGLEFEVVDVDPRRIKYLRISRLANPPAAGNG